MANIVKKTKTVPQNFISELQRCVSYDPDTGVLTWKALLSSKSRARIGEPVGKIDNGYLRFKFMDVRLSGHRAAWILMTGAFCSTEIDHKDVNPSNNKWSNLRQATRSQNKANMGPPKTNTSGVKGVRYEKDRRKWLATIRSKEKFGGPKFLGRFATKEEATLAYQNAADACFGEFARFK
jgi:hypothetical protein